MAKTATDEPVHRSTAQLDIQVKRVYEPASPTDGVRILIDRLWPRGLTKTEAALDHWMRDLAPSADLRRWFGHDPSRWDAFRQQYARQVGRRTDLLEQVRSLARAGPGHAAVRRA